MRESKCYISVACFHYGGSDLLRFGKFEVLITSQALLSQKQPIFMQNYNFVKNDVFVAKICKYALYESSEGLFCAPRKAANFCHPGLLQQISGFLIFTIKATSMATVAKLPFNETFPLSTPEHSFTHVRLLSCRQ